MRQGRFQQAASGRLKQFGESVSFDWQLYRQDIAGSMAHARGLQAAGILTPDEFAAIEQGLLAIRDDIESGRFEFSEELEDVHMNIEAELTRRIGPAGAKLHTGRSRNDQVATDIRLFLREELAGIQGFIRRLQAALTGLARKNQSVIMPGYTHLQRAQPVLFAHHLLAYCEMLERDHSRIADAVRRFNLCPLGSGAIAGSTIVLDRAAIARELGFDGITQNSMDAIADRDFACEVLAALAITGMHLSRLGEDVILWASTEFGFIELDDAHTTGSSLMPQKKNPDIAELVRGKAGRLYGNLVALLTVTKGLPMTYNRDLQEDKEPLFDSLRTVRNSLEIFAEMLDGARVQAGAAGRAAADPALLATDLADLLVRRGVPFREAHAQVGQLVARAEQDGTPLDQLSPAVLGELAPRAVEGYAEVFELRRALELRGAPGTPAPEQVAARLDWWEKHLAG